MTFRFRTIYRVILPAVACLATLQAQRVIPTFSAYKATTGTAETVTIQQPSSGGKQTRYVGADVYCSVACVATLKQNGTAATATTLTPVALTRGATATNTAWSGSNVGAGTTIRTVDIAAGSTVSIDLSKLFIDGSNTARNFSITTAGASGDIKITIVWQED